jgi:hypothetical protein
LGLSGYVRQTCQKYIFAPHLKGKFQTGDLIFENKQKATISKGPRFFWLALSCGAIDPIALLLLLTPLLLLLLVFLLFFFGFCMVKSMNEGRRSPVFCMLIAPLRR